MITDDGRELWTSATGAGEPILCCHGGPGLWDMFGTLDLGSRYRLIRWDQRGAGRSDRRGPYTLERMVADVDAVREHHGLAHVAVLGHSWGAQLALLYALAHPERVSALVYVSGVGLGHGWHAEFKRNFERVLGARHARWAELRETDRGEAEERELAVLQWTADFVAQGKQRAEAVPTLIVDGTADNRPRWAVDSLEQALPAVTRVRLSGVGHVPWLEAPDEFRTALLDFLSRA